MSHSPDDQPCGNHDLVDGLHYSLARAHVNTCTCTHHENGTRYPSARAATTASLKASGLPGYNLATSYGPHRWLHFIIASSIASSIAAFDE